MSSLSRRKQTRKAGFDAHGEELNMHAGGVDDAGRVRFAGAEPFLKTARFSHVRTPSIHGICTAQTHQLLAKIVAKSSEEHEVRLLLLRYCPPKRQGHHPITESIAESTSSVCVCAKI